MFEEPCFGATKKTMPMQAMTVSEAYTRKPGEMNSALNSRIVVVVDSCGPLRAMTSRQHSSKAQESRANVPMITAPIMQRAQPSFPKSVSVSLRKILERIAAKTTLSAPSGVTRMAAVNAYAPKFNISPKIINTIPRIHTQSFKYA